EAAGKPAGQTLRLKVTERLLEQAAADPAQNLPRADRLLHALHDPLSPRPAEAHLLVMLQRDLARTDPASPPLLPAKFLTQALRVRVRAERAALGLTSDDQAAPEDRYPYCPQVIPWIRGRVEEADRLRRQGEDLLFASDRENWEKGGRLLDQAEKIYRLAQDEAVRVRPAFAARDEVRAALPDSARWLARRSLAEDNPRQREDALLLERIEQLGKDVHALADSLERQAPRAGGKAADPAGP